MEILYYCYSFSIMLRIVYLVFRKILEPLVYSYTIPQHSFVVQLLIVEILYLDIILVNIFKLSLIDDFFIFILLQTIYTISLMIFTIYLIFT